MEKAPGSEPRKTHYQLLSIEEREALVVKAEKDLEEAKKVLKLAKDPRNYEGGKRATEHAQTNIEVYKQKLEGLKADLEKARAGEEI